MNNLKKLWTKFLSLKTWQKVIVLLLILSVLSAITGTSNDASTKSSADVSENISTDPVVKSTLDILNDSSVNWDNYAPAVKQRIADLVEAGDCANLQIEFNNADSNNDTQRSRTGESNSELMILIDEQMKSLNCY